MKIADKIADLKEELFTWNVLEKSVGRSPYTKWNKQRVLDTLQLATRHLRDGYTYTNENCDGFWGEATQDDIKEHVEVNILEEQQNE